MLVPLLAFAVPLYDSFSVIFIRLAAGESIMRGDRRHFSHRLLRRGMSPRAALLTICLATAATGLAAVAMTRANWTVAALIVAQCACVVAMVAVMEFGPRGNRTE
jgi:UDP-GlcNAc:undecaprenyl-phosphate GlcNAc-1-phosphate transferase